MTVSSQKMASVLTPENSNGASRTTPTQQMLAKILLAFNTLMADSSSSKGPAPLQQVKVEALAAVAHLTSVKRPAILNELGPTPKAAKVTA